VEIYVSGILSYLRLFKPKKYLELCVGYFVYQSNKEPFKEHALVHVLKELYRVYSYILKVSSSSSTISEIESLLPPQDTKFNIWPMEDSEAELAKFEKFLTWIENHELEPNLFELPPYDIPKLIMDEVDRHFFSSQSKYISEII